jgi:tetrahydromethanopterin S-methyltransferase subunit B
VTQSKMEDLLERQDKLEVMIEALMRKMDKLSTEMITRHDVPSRKGNEIKRFSRQALSR